MLTRTKTAALSIFLSFALPPASAELISIDSNYGPDTITLDTDTGVEWLDLTLTVDRTFDDIAAQLSAGAEFEGFEHATVAEVAVLWSNAGVVEIATHDPPLLPEDYSAANLQPVLDLVDLLGETLSVGGNPLAEGFTADSPDGIPQVNIIGELNACITPSCVFFNPNLEIDTAVASLGPNRDARDEAIFFVGHYLMRDSAPDSDGDGVADDADNCITWGNPAQTDTDGDGFGNSCDADFNQDCVVNFVDLGEFKPNIFSALELFDLSGGPAGDPNGQVDFVDLGRLKATFFNQGTAAGPGPSGSGPCVPE